MSQRRGNPQADHSPNSLPSKGSGSTAATDRPANSYSFPKTGKFIPQVPQFVPQVLRLISQVLIFIPQDLKFFDWCGSRLGNASKPFALAIIKPGGETG
jgi:hypothetical protein